MVVGAIELLAEACNGGLSDRVNSVEERSVGGRGVIMLRCGGGAEAAGSVH